MSNKISRRAFLKCAGVSAAAVGSASLLSGCKTNGSNTTVNDVKVGDTVKNWNGLGVQLSSVFHLTQDPARPGYEYLGVRVTVLNRSKTRPTPSVHRAWMPSTPLTPCPRWRTWTPTSRPWPLLPPTLLPPATVRVPP